MPSRHDDSADMPGQDSFLDVVANIVGILILLVMVLGVRASYVVSPLAEEPEPPNEERKLVSEEDVEAAERAAAEDQAKLHALVQQAREMREQRLLREEERQMLATFVASGEREIKERRAALNENQQRDFDLRRQLADTQRELDDLTRQQISLLSQEPEAEVIENLPTPLAKTVTGRQVYLRLADGHVAVVPADELFEEFQDHVDRNLWRLREQSVIEGTVGPIDGFRLRYRFGLTRVGVTTPSGFEQVYPVPQYVAEYVPMTPRIGVPVDQAVLPNSDLLRTLQRYSPTDTTITIWTYPDSFGDFRHLKKVLYDLGFSTAGRPLPEGELIGRASQGTKSAAQ